MERSCELCSKAARMYCESDEARLCWDCDEKVHSANFLVAKHSRSLLCHVCQLPTPWKASGNKLCPTVSVCEGCFEAQNPTSSRMRRMGMGLPHPRQEEKDEDENDRITGMEVGDRESESSSARSTDDEDYSSVEEEDDQIEEVENGENQVVPWASCPSQSDPSAPPLATSSSSEHGSFSTRNDALKRSRDCHIQDSDDEDVCCSSKANSNMAAEGSREVAASELRR